MRNRRATLETWTHPALLDVPIVEGSLVPWMASWSPPRHPGGRCVRTVRPETTATRSDRTGMAGRDDARARCASAWILRSASVAAADSGAREATRIAGRPETAGTVARPAHAAAAWLATTEARMTV